MWLPLTTWPQTNCGHNLKKMDWLPGADLRSQGLFYALGEEVGFHKLKSSKIPVYGHASTPNPDPLQSCTSYCFFSFALWMFKESTIASPLISSQGTPAFPTGALVATAEIIVGMATGIPPMLLSEGQVSCQLPNVRRIDVTAGLCTSRQKCKQTFSCLLLSVGLLCWNLFFYFRPSWMFFNRLISVISVSIKLV